MDRVYEKRGCPEENRNYKETAASNRKELKFWGT